MKEIVSLCLYLLVHFCATSQPIPDNPNLSDSNGHRIGKWTILYDEQGKTTFDVGQAFEYMVFYYEDDKPKGIVQKYSLDGVLKWEGYMIQDRPGIVMDGEVTTYLEDGTKSISRYYKDGRIANFDEAIEWFEQRLEIIERELGPDHPDYPHYLNCIAISCEKQGLYAKAEPYYLEAMERTKSILGDEHPLYSTVLHNLGKLYYYQGRYEKAEKRYLETKSIAAKHHGKEHVNYATILNNLAALYLKQGDYARVEPLMKETLEINLQTVGKNHRNYATALNNLAIIYARQNKNTEAEPLLKEALQVYEKTLGKEHHQYTLSVTNLARLYVNLNRFDEAEKYFIEGKLIDEKVSGKNHPTYKNTILSLARFYDKLDRLEKAEPLYVESINIQLKNIDINFSQLSESEKGQYLATFYDDFEVFHSFVLRRMATNPSIINQNYNMILSTKGLLFDLQQKVKKRIVNSNDSLLIELFESWQDARTRLSQLFHKTQKEREEAGENIAETEELVNNLEKQLSARSSLFTTANDHKRYTWRDVQSKLKPHEAAVEIIRFRYHKEDFTDSLLYAAMVVTSATKTNPQLVVLSNGNELETKYIRYYQNSIKFKTKDTLSYHAFWKKIHNELDGRTTVYLSSDGIYHSLSISGLYNPQNQRYLVDELDIRPLVSTRYLISHEKKQIVTKNVQLMGFPDYNRISEPRKSIDTLKGMKNIDPLLSGNFIRPLPGTELEIAKLKNILSRAQYHVTLSKGEYATESQLKSWNSPLIGHIATHGYFLNEDDMNSSAIAGISSDKYLDNPLLRSGLLLANARNAITNGGDGILTAFEAKSLNLDETELIVLSACETGLGHIKNGEGVYGLQRAFQTAGAASVLMSLWTVNDEATQQLMVNFYTQWLLNGYSKRVAFRKAQTALRNKYTHPYYWSAFVMVGE